MASPPATTATEKKLSQLKAFFVCTGVGGSVLSFLCTLLNESVSYALAEEVSGGWAVLFVLCVIIAVAVLVSGAISYHDLTCSMKAPAAPAAPSPATVVLPPNAYELAELAVELRHVTAALAAATAEEAEGAAAAADAPPGSEPQLRQQILRQQKEILELRQTVLRTQAAPNEETAAPPREESPSAEVEAELARMREAAALKEKERLLNAQHTAVEKMKEKCRSSRVIVFYVLLLCNAVVILCALVGGICTYTLVREDSPSVRATVKPLLIVVAVFWLLSTVLFFVSGWSLSQYERLAEAHMTMRVPAEEVTVEAAEAMTDAPHKTLWSEEEK